MPAKKKAKRGGKPESGKSRDKVVKNKEPRKGTTPRIENEVREILKIKRKISSLTEKEIRLKEKLGDEGYCIECKRKYLSKNCDAEITDGEGLIVKYVILCPEGHKMAEFMIDNRDSQVG